ncbi:MAG: hypothetical protein AAFX08_04830 [Pseudomonadota bacterium]
MLARVGAALVFSAALAACAGDGDKDIDADLAAAAPPPLRTDAVDPASRELSFDQPADPSASDRSPPWTGMEQISPEAAEQIAAQIAAAQIAAIGPDGEEVRLSVEQLREYRDRCAPDAKTPPPPGYDCSEARLRIRRAFRTEDDLARALAIIDLLGRPEARRNLQGLPIASSQSIDAQQAVAGGAIDLNAPTSLVAPGAQMDPLAAGLPVEALEGGEFIIAPGVTIVLPRN